MPLKFQMYFVIGAVRDALRLSALESMVVSFFLWESVQFQQVQAARYRILDSLLLLRGRQPKPDAQPAPDQMPVGFGGFSGSASAKSDGVRLDKKAGAQPEGGWRPFGYFSGEGKVPLRSKPVSKKKGKIPGRVSAGERGG